MPLEVLDHWTIFTVLQVYRAVNASNDIVKITLPGFLIVKFVQIQIILGLKRKETKSKVERHVDSLQVTITCFIKRNCVLAGPQNGLAFC